MEKIVGIPGTIDASVRQLRWIRMPPRLQGNNPGPFYSAETADGTLYACVSHEAEGANGRKLWHLSVSHRDRDGRPDRVPNWAELKHARYRLVQADVSMILVFPKPTANHLDLAETCLHLYESEYTVDF